MHIVRSKRVPHLGKMLQIKAGQLNQDIPTDINESRERAFYPHHSSTKDTFMISVLV